MLIAITGGIGCGKSVVSQLLRVMGYTVYDCDTEAKRLMIDDEALRQQLSELFGPQTYQQTPNLRYQLNKAHLSACIFGRPEALYRMNQCVHPVVARDLMQRVAKMTGNKPFFFESAILYESGFGRLVPPDQVWSVSAPLTLRRNRAQMRDQSTHEQIMARIEAQLPQEEKDLRADHVIFNTPEQSVIAQVRRILATYDTDSTGGIAKLH